MPLTSPCRCGISGAPVAQGAFLLSHAPLSRGAIVSSLSTAFFGWTGTSLMRFSTATNAQLGDLAIAGAGDLRWMDYNPSNGFLYVADVGNSKVLKINPSTGAVVSTLSPVGIGSLTDIVYCPQTTSIFSFSSTADFNVWDTNDVRQNGVLTVAGATRGVWVNSTSRILVTVGTVLNEINPANLAVTSVAVGGISYSGLDYSNTSGFCLLGLTNAAANGIVKYDPVARIVANIANAPAVAVRGIGFNASNQLHFAVADVSGLCYFISDNSFSIIGQTNIGGGANPNIPLALNSKTYVPSNGQSTITVFTP